MSVQNIIQSKHHLDDRSRLAGWARQSFKTRQQRKHRLSLNFGKQLSTMNSQLKVISTNKKRAVTLFIDILHLFSIILRCISIYRKDSIQQVNFPNSKTDIRNPNPVLITGLPLHTGSLYFNISFKGSILAYNRR